jgi:hypothetical protein
MVFRSAATVLLPAVRTRDRGPSHAERLGVGLEAATGLFNKAALLEQRLGRADTAEPLLHRALTIAKQVYGPVRPEVAIRF